MIKCPYNARCFGASLDGPLVSWVVELQGRRGKTSQLDCKAAHLGHWRLGMDETPQAMKPGSRRLASVPEKVFWTALASRIVSWGTASLGLKPKLQELTGLEPTPLQHPTLHWGSQHSYAAPGPMFDHKRP